MTDLAREKADDMIVHEYIEHYSPRLGRPGHTASRDGLVFSSYGENIAGTLEAVDVEPEVAFNQLMESKYHKEAILSDRKCCLGIGVVRGLEKGIVYVMHFMLQ